MDEYLLKIIRVIVAQKCKNEKNSISIDSVDNNYHIRTKQKCQIDH